MRHFRTVGLAGVLTIAMALLVPTPAHAVFHFWEIKEVYSNSSGSIQYIELFTTFGSQDQVNAHTITATSSIGTRTFTFPGNSPTGTASKHLLIATPGFANIPGNVTPDFVLPCGPFFDPASATITINFGGADSLTITSPAVPTNGTDSLNETTLSENTTTFAVSANTPTNFAGVVGSLNLTTCQNNGTCDACTDALFCNGVETCASGMCAGPDPCPLMCNETTDMCFECDDVTDCNDNNPCTTDTCNGAPTGTCVHTNNTLTCNDNLFCTLVDTCSGGTCLGAGDACPGQNCSEGLDICGDCANPAHCDDSVFCNGAETCTTGVCGAATAGPCDPLTETCEEPTDVCQAICGNAELDGTEVCDDGNEADGDGCSAACAIEDGFDCDVTTEPSICTAIPPPDAGVPDAEPSPDAGTDPPDEDAGCCSTGRDHLGGGTVAMLALVGALLLRRRRDVQRNK